MNAYDLIWGALLGLSAPVWLALPRARRKTLKALRERMGPTGVTRDLSRPAVMIHAVSLGEMNATRALVAGLAQARPDLQFIVSTTTDTGHARGVELYGANPDITLIRYPLDFSRAIDRLLADLRPSVVALMELEVWPNFTLKCAQRGIPVVLVNGRLTESSFKAYRWCRPIVRRMFRRLEAICAQEQAYAKRFIALGAPHERVTVTGTMKFDTARLADRIEGDAPLAEAVGLRPTAGDGNQRVWVCGSTGPGEESILLGCFDALVGDHPGLRMVIVPRKPERFDDVAGEIREYGFPLVRRSRPGEILPPHHPEAADHAADQPIILGDTMGELAKFYSLADVVFVGRTLVDLGPRQHGSDMIEPAAIAKPTIVGPWTGNFTEPTRRLREANAIKVVIDAAALRETISHLLNDPPAAAEMGRRAQDVVRQQQGATARHVQVILRALGP